MSKKDFMAGFCIGYIGSIIMLSYIQSYENKRLITRLQAENERRKNIMLAQLDENRKLAENMIQNHTRFDKFRA